MGGIFGDIMKIWKDVILILGKVLMWSYIYNWIFVDCVFNYRFFVECCNDGGLLS